MSRPRVLVWFSCGAASAVAAKLAVEKYKSTHAVEVLYCDTLAYEHQDNKRFMSDIEHWIGQPIQLLKSTKYRDIYDVFERTKWLVGPGGARCTTELKKLVRRSYERDGDIQVFGFTAEEAHRVDRFHIENPEIIADFILLSEEFTKRECFMELQKAGIELPAMYKLGYANNNCIGCVKGGQGYWNKIRVDFPDTFERMAKLERKLNAAINKRYENGKRIRVFLDELSPAVGRYDNEPDIECGVLCISEKKEQKP